MLVNLEIKYLSLNKNCVLFSNKIFDLNFSQQEDCINYWYKNINTPIAPKTIWFKGDFSSGKSTIFMLLRDIKELIINNKPISKFYQFDIVMTFYISGIFIRYEIKKFNNIISDYLFFNTQEIKSDNGISITKSNTPIIYSWFSNIFFISSIYDYNDLYLDDIKKIRSKQKTNDLLSKYRTRFQHSCAYLTKLINQSSFNLRFLQTIDNKIIISTPESMLNKSTWDLLETLKIIEFINNIEEGIIVIDDIELIAKNRFMQLIHDKFVSVKAKTPVQLIAFSNKDICDSYEGRKLFSQAKKVELDYII